MNIINTELEDVYIVEPDVFNDERGFFFESYSKLTFPDKTIEFVQDNHSLSKLAGTIRGIHFQVGDFVQSKLVRCLSGELVDYAIDLRENSKTFKKWTKVVLSSDNKKMFFVPKGFGHLIVTLKDNTEILYKVDNYYSKENERIVNYLDPEINLDIDVLKPILSEKDRIAPLLKDCDIKF